MPRKPLINTEKFPYHITNRSNNKDFFYLPLNELWELFLEVLKKVIELYGATFHAFVLMDNHYHLIIHCPRKNLSSCMTYLHREVAKRSNIKCNRKNHFWGGRYKWSVIQNEIYYWNAIKYVLRNPVKAGVVKSVENYKFSSLNIKNEQLFQIIDFFNNFERTIELDLKWLNESFSEEKDLAIKNALRRKVFEPSKSKTGKLIKLDSYTY